MTTYNEKAHFNLNKFFVFANWVTKTDDEEDFGQK